LHVLLQFALLLVLLYKYTSFLLLNTMPLYAI
jgi:hypothetical protein